MFRALALRQNNVYNDVLVQMSNQKLLHLNTKCH